MSHLSDSDCFLSDLNFKLTFIQQNRTNLLLWRSLHAFFVHPREIKFNADITNLKKRNTVFHHKLASLFDKFIVQLFTIQTFTVLIIV